MAAASIVSGIFSLVSAFGAKDDAKSAARDQERISRENAMNIESEGREQERRARIEQTEAEAAQRARVGASGLKGSGSQATFMLGEEEKFMQEIDWLRKSTSSKAGYERSAGKLAADTTRRKGDAAFYSGLGGAAGDFGSGYSSYKSSGSWWS